MTYSTNKIASNSLHNRAIEEDIKETEIIIQSYQVAEGQELDDSPYKGLEPYEEVDSDIFFGRKNDIQKVVNNLLAWPLTILYGKSGVGKSSLLRAGVTHTLNEEARENIEDYGVPKLAVVVFPSLGGEYDLKLMTLDSVDNLPKKAKSLVIIAKIDIFYHVRIFDSNGKKVIDKGKNEFVPDENLFQQLEQAFSRQAINLQTKNEVLQKIIKISSSLDHTLEGNFSWQDDPLTGLMMQIEETISRSGWNIQSPMPGLSFIDTLRGWTEALGGEEKNGELYIILDQFEEYFLYHSQENRQERFAVEFSRAVNSDLPVNFLISIRDDSFAKLARFKRYIPDLSKHTVEIKHLDGKSAYQAIEEPVKIYNHQVPPDRSVEIKSDLIKAVLKGIKQFVPIESGRAGIEKQESEIEAPYLQLVVTRLWKEMNPTSRCLNIETLISLADQRFKGNDKQIQSAIKKIFRQHLETALNQLSSHEKDIVANIFQYLVTPSGTKYAYSLSDLYTNYESEYGEELKCTKSEFTFLLETLAKGRQRILSPLPALPNQPAEERRFQIFHDILGQPILNWRSRYIAEKTKVQLEIRDMELASIDALRQFAVDGLQLKALLNAMWAGDKLKKLLRRKVVLEDTAQARVMLALQKILDGIRERNQVQRPGSPSLAMCLSPDGQQLATGAVDGVIALWDLHGHCIHSFGTYRSIIPSLSFHPDGAQLAVAYMDGHIQRWDIQGNLLGEFSQSSLPYCIQFSPDGQFLAVGLANGITQLLDLHGQPLAKCHGNGLVYRIKFSPDGRHLLTASIMNVTDYSACLWTTQGKLVRKFGVPGKMIVDISFSPDGQSVATALSDMTVFLWDIKGHQRAELKGHKGIIAKVDFSPDGQQIRTVAWDGTARWWDLQGDQIRKLKICRLSFYQASFSPDGYHLVSLSLDGMSHLLHTATQQNTPVTELNGQGGVNYCVDFHPDGQCLVTASADGTAVLWTLRGECLRAFKAHQGAVYGVQFSPDGHTLATASVDGTARLWTLEGQPLVEFKGHRGPVGKVSFSPNGQLLATASFDLTASIWNCQGKRLAELKGHGGPVFSVSFSPDGRYVATASTDTVVRLWTLQGDLVREVRGHGSIVNYVSFSSDGQYLVTSSWDGTARIWDLNGNVVAKFRDHLGPVYWANFSPDGHQLATASGDGTVSLWDMKGNQLAEFRDHQGEVYGVHFSPDGKYLATASADGTSKLRRVEGLDQLFARGCAWLQDYFETHPQEREQLNLCSYVDKTGAAPMLQSERVSEAVKEEATENE